MGLFDDVYVDKKIIEEYDLTCPQCGNKLYNRWFQTKDLECAMDNYWLSYIEGTKDVTLFLLNPPDDTKYWVEYTPEEIEERNSKVKLSFFKLEEGDGYWKKPAFLPENRKSKPIGEMLHQWVRVYDRCSKDCKVFCEFNLKFTDGLLKEVRRITWS